MVLFYFETIPILDKSDQKDGQDLETTCEFKIIIFIFTDKQANAMAIL